MNYGKLLSEISIGLSVLSGIGYLFAGDYRRAIYWIAAAVLTSSVTF